MKKTILRPVAFGSMLGLLAGLATTAGLTFLISTSETSNAIGIYSILILLAAALGGPIAGILASTIFLTVTTLYGSPAMKEILSEPVVFWSNAFALGTVLALVALAYRWVFERAKLPMRFIAWAGIVIGYYSLQIPVSMTPQYLLVGDFELLPALLFAYQSYIPQAVVDIFVTSLIFIALPLAYTHPLWYEPKSGAVLADEDQGPDESVEMTNEMSMDV